MKFEKLLISHDTPTQVLESRKILDSMGYKVYSDNRWASDLYIHTYDDGDYQILSMGGWHQGSKKYSFNEFVSKYEKQNEMIETINKAKSELKMNDSELSLALGKSRQYIGKMMRLPQSKKVQDKVIKEINALLTRDKFGKLSIGNHTHMSIENVEVNGGEIFVTGTIQDPKDKQISDLKKANEQQKLVIDKLDDQLLKVEKIHNEDVKSIESKDKEISKFIELRKEDLAKNAELWKVNEKLKHEIDCKGLRISELKENLEQSKRETDYFVNQFKRVEDELKELKSSHTTSKALNWFFVVAIILAAIVWKAYNG